MSAAGELEEYERQAPGAVELAVHASIAAHVEGELLRRLRVRFAPHVDAGAESDLWFGPLVEAWSASGFALSPPFVPLLQERFKKLDRREEIAEAIVEFHRTATPAVAMQERIAWLALERGDEANAEIEAELEKAVAALGDESRADGVARWAAQALSRLPEIARETDAAAVLELAAAVRAGSPWSFQDSSGRGFPRGAQLALPSGALSRERKVWLRLSPGRLEVVPAGTGAEVTAPDTRPVVLEVSWPAILEVSSEGSVEGEMLDPIFLQRQLLVGEVGQAIALPPHVDRAELRTLAGDRYRISVRSEGTAPIPGNDPSSLLRQICVPIAWGGEEGTAYFAEPNWLVTASDVLPDCPVHTHFAFQGRAAYLSRVGPEVQVAALYVPGEPHDRPISAWPPYLRTGTWIAGGYRNGELSMASGSGDFVDPSPAVLTSGSPIVAGGTWRGHVIRRTNYVVTPAERVRATVEQAKRFRGQLDDFLEVRRLEIAQLVLAAEKMGAVGLVGPPGSGHTTALALALEELQRRGFSGAWLSGATDGSESVRTWEARLVRAISAVLEIPSPSTASRRTGVSSFLRRYLPERRFAVAFDGAGEMTGLEAADFLSTLRQQPSVTILFGAYADADTGFIKGEVELIHLEDLEWTQIETMVRQSGVHPDLVDDRAMREWLGGSPLLWTLALSGLKRDILPGELLDPSSDGYRRTFGAHLEALQQWLQLHPEAEAGFRYVVLGPRPQSSPVLLEEPERDELERAGLLDRRGRLRAGLYRQLLPGADDRLPPKRRG